MIRTNAPVRSVLVRDGRARGVVLENGEEIAATLVASNLDPKLTFLHLLDERELPPEFVAAIRNFRIEGTSCKINLALSGLPDFRAYPGAPGTAPQGHDAHLPFHRICRARVGRRQVRPSLGVAAARIDDPHNVRSDARAAGPPHHGHLSAIRAVHLAGRHVGTNCASLSPIAS